MLGRIYELYCDWNSDDEPDDEYKELEKRHYRKLNNKFEILQLLLTTAYQKFTVSHIYFWLNQIRRRRQKIE